MATENGVFSALADFVRASDNYKEIPPSELESHLAKRVAKMMQGVVLSSNLTNFSLDLELEDNTLVHPQPPSSKVNLRAFSSKQLRPHSIHGLQIDRETNNVIPEIELLREILFAFQGLNGRILIQNPENDHRYMINQNYKIDPSTKEFALRLSNIGWLFNKIDRFCQSVTKDSTNGRVSQSFAAALSEEILEYYRLITVIEQQLHFMTSYDKEVGESPLVSLHRLQIWSFDQFYKLKMLALLVENCKNKRGGALANIVYKNMQHGDPQLKACLTRILNQVVLPIRQMLSQWIFHGEIEDTYKEFFITTRSGQTVATDDSLWHEKFLINKSMLPGFIPMEQAKKILATGKAINLLLQVCVDHSFCIPGYEELKKAFKNTDVELLFKENKSPSGEKGEFRRLLQSAYKETSLNARKILFDDYRLMDHLSGLRQFLLLGQGDFIRHLMDLLAPELEKPAHKLQTHSLNSLLNAAIRSTNAQFLNEDVINRLDSILTSNSIDESGWDIFSLAYQTKGPIGTILTQRCMSKYSTLFKHLWRSKRMEYVLSSLWKRQMSHQRFMKTIPRLKCVFHQSYMVLSEMTHFVQQMQYYIEFEVMECSWAEFLRRIESSEDIDQLVEAHEWFLEMVTARSMVAAESEFLSNQLRATYDVVIQFQSIQEKLSELALKEIDLRLKFSLLEKQDVTNINDGDRKTEQERRHAFDTETIPSYQFKIRMVATMYQDMVQKFLLLLADNHDLNLQFLSIRLDFNEHYQKRNKSLETSFTYSHRLSIDTSK